MLMDAWSLRQRKKVKVKARASVPNSMYNHCRIIGCAEPARAGTSDGLDLMYCRSHADLHQRHGSSFKVSYTAKVLNPYRRAALGWLESNEKNPWARNAVERVNGLYSQAGPHVEAFRLRGMNAEERAKAHWARLRKAAIDPRLVVAAWLAVEMSIRDDSQPITTQEFKRVQATKLVHRMASGTHRRWEQQVNNPNNSWQPKIRVTELHVFPRSRGRILRHIGKDLEQTVELLVAHHLADIYQFKKHQDTRGSFCDRPYPRNTVSRKRKRPLLP